MQRASVSGRPSGTDGSDFSYRMVVDSRYQRVAEGKTRLSALFFTQALVQFTSAVILFLSTPPRESLDRLSVTSSIICFLSLFLGELGRKRSRVNLLKLYMFGSWISTLISVASLYKSGKLLKVIQHLSNLDASNLEFLKIAAILLGVVVQIFTFAMTISLIRNMAPPKRTS